MGKWFLLCKAAVCLGFQDMYPSPPIPKSCPGEVKVLVSLSKHLTAGSEFLHVSQGGSTTQRNLRHTHWRALTVGAAISY